MAVCPQRASATSQARIHPPRPTLETNASFCRFSISGSEQQAADVGKAPRQVLKKEARRASNIAEGINSAINSDGKRSKEMMTWKEFLYQAEAINEAWWEHRGAGGLNGLLCFQTDKDTDKDPDAGLMDSIRNCEARLSKLGQIVSWNAGIVAGVASCRRPPSLPPF